MKRRARELDGRRSKLTQQRLTLTEQRSSLATDNKLRRRIKAFASTVTAAIDKLDFEGRQQLLRLVVEEVRVRGFNVEIQLKIPLDGPPPTTTPTSPLPPRPGQPRHPTRGRPTKPEQPALSSEDRLRSIGDDEGAVVHDGLFDGLSAEDEELEVGVSALLAGIRSDPDPVARAEHHELVVVEGSPLGTSGPAPPTVRRRAR